jgi:hypothetical protein
MEEDTERTDKESKGECIMKGLIGFVAGLGIGGVATWLLTKEYYRRLADEEIKSVVERDRFRRDEERREEEVNKEKEDREERNEKEEKRIYTDLTKNYTKPSVTEYAAKYIQHDTVEDIDYADTEHPEDDEEESPHIISSEEFFNEGEDYEKNTFVYYADGYVVEGEGAYAHIIDNVDEVIGSDALDSFGDDPDDPDVVYVRNDTLQTDYEILRSLDKYYQ